MKILTIGIPTYNRASYLNRCLSELFEQLKGYEDIIDIQVSDNASSDNTAEIIKKYNQAGYSIDYVKHDTNLGMDGNFISLYNRCSTKYMWMLSDDDFLLPNALKKVINLIKKDEFGILYLNHLWFDTEFDASRIDANPDKIYTKYSDPLEFVEKVNYWFTFISGNIINKSIIKDKVSIEKLDGTFLALLGWIVPAVFQGLPNYVIENHMLACKANNAGGYKLFKVFGENFNYVMDELIKSGCDKRIKNIINRHLLSSFFPGFLTKKNPNFIKEKYLASLLPVFWNYKEFWRGIFPVLLKQQLNIR